MDWMNPIRALLEAFQVFSFDMKMMRSECLVGQGPVASFTLAQAPFPLAVPVIFITLVIVRKRVWATIRPQFFNTLGAVLNALFIGIVIACISPLICYRHPGDAGSSMRSAPGVLCFAGGEHAGMLAIGAVAVLTMPVPFTAAVVYGTWSFKRAARGAGGDALSARFGAQRFLTMRFVADRYYYAPVLLLRSLLICLVPVVFQEAAVQIVVLAMVLISFLILQAFLQPWRGLEANVLDGAMSGGLLVMLICGGLVAGGRASLTSGLADSCASPASAASPPAASWWSSTTTA
eukprot:SRR837773.13449.p1 GENE.SRR837773.13449~~SRR837773.13449.p1  ORF type:complete len:313 (-),score=53.43 SRR837773.13449:451-1323(-)